MTIAIRFPLIRQKVVRHYHIGLARVLDSQLSVDEVLRQPRRHQPSNYNEHLYNLHGRRYP